MLLTSVMVMRMTVTMMMMMSPPVTCDDEPAVAVRAGGPGLPPGDSGKKRSLEKVNANLNINFQLFSLFNGFGENVLTLSLEVYLLALHAHAVIDIIRRIHFCNFSSLSLSSQITQITASLGGFPAT